MHEDETEGTIPDALGRVALPADWGAELPWEERPNLGLEVMRVEEPPSRFLEPDEGVRSHLRERGCDPDRHGSIGVACGQKNKDQQKEGTHSVLPVV
jgi:hypothetical protein